MLNQHDFAKELGIDQGHISNIEQSKKTPSEQLILSICRTFGVRYEWLTKGEGTMKEGFKGIEEYKIKEDPPKLLKIVELLREEDDEGMNLVLRFLRARKDLRNNLGKYVIDKPKKK